MANTAGSITDLNACTSPDGTDQFLLSSNVSGNAVSMKISANTLLSNTANVSVLCTVLTISTNAAPASNTSPPAGTPNNSIWSDGSYLYYWNGTKITRAVLNDF